MCRNLLKNRNGLHTLQGYGHTLFMIKQQTLKGLHVIINEM
jgi:hypothetical protein